MASFVTAVALWLLVGIFKNFPAVVEASNVAISSDLVVVVAGEGLPGLISRRIPDGVEQIFPLPFNKTGYISGFEDVTFDENDPGLVFAFGKEQAIVCAFQVKEEAELAIRSCVFGFPVLPFSGVSVRDGKVVISGGGGGLTLYDFNKESVTFGEQPVYLSKSIDNTLVLLDALLVTPNLAAVSAEFETGDCSFGTIMVDINPPPTALYSFCEDNVGVPEGFAFEASNFPLQSALYTNAGDTYLYTVSGTVTVHDPFSSNSTGNSTAEISFDIPSLLAGDGAGNSTGNSTTETSISNSSLSTSSLVLAVNPERKYLILGTVDDTGDDILIPSDGFHIEVYDLADDPWNPSLVEDFPIVGRVSSVASRGDYVAYTTTEMIGEDRNTSYSFFALPAAAPTISPAPTASVTLSPTSNATGLDDPTLGGPTLEGFVSANSSSQSSNLVISSELVLIFAGAGTPGLISRQLPNGTEHVFSLPWNIDSITEIDDVAIDPDNPSFVFTLGTVDGKICSFVIKDDASTNLVGCFAIFDAIPFSGISARDGKVVVAGGFNGYEVYSYDPETGDIIELLDSQTLSPGSSLYTGVLLLNNSLAAFSTHFDVDPENTRYGTTLVDLENGTMVNIFLVEESIGSNYSLTPSNYPLENALYEMDDGRIVMLTVNGALTIQDSFVPQSTVEIVFDGFSAITLAINQEKQYLLLGGVNDEEEFSIRIYFVGNPQKPRLFDEIFGVGRITSLATEGNMAAYSTTAIAGSFRSSFYQVFELPEMPEELPPEDPTTAPSQTPTESASPTVTPMPTLLNASNISTEAPSEDDQSGGTSTSTSYRISAKGVSLMSVVATSASLLWN